MTSHHGDTTTGPTRRRFLAGIGAVSGLGAVFHGLVALGLQPAMSAQAAMPAFPPDAGAGKKVLVLGAGIAGLALSNLLARHGFDVTVLEADARAGGRSLTLRDGDRVQERGGPPQVARYSPNRYADGALTESAPYFNAGPARIPQHHRVTLDWCRRLGVRLEPYIFLSEANLLQSDRAFDGRPVPFRRVRFNLQGEIAELLAKVTNHGALDAELTGIDRDAFLAMLRQFGDLARAPDGSLVFEGTPRAGYVSPPGAGLDGGVLADRIPLPDIMGSGFWGWDLFTSLQYFWQTSLVQPVGGMDRIWRALLEQPVPGGRTVSDLVRLSRPVRAVRMIGGDKAEIVHGPEEDVAIERADFVVSTIPPRRLLTMADGISDPFREALSRIAYVPATKVAFQMKSRFWESVDGIYGGISWTSGISRQLWYPSSEFQSETGVLVAAYNNGRAAEIFGRLPVVRRYEVAATYGERFHPGHFLANVKPESAVSVAWGNMTFHDGGWPVHLAESDPDAYTRLVRLTPQGRLYLAGDYLSHWPGWQEGAFATAERAFIAITERALSRD